jgi:membrane associated rhomboid family serine protease
MVVALTPDTIDINMEKGGFLSFRRADIVRVELSIDRTRKTAKGAAIGAALGAGLFYLVLRDTDSDEYWGYEPISGSQAAATGMIGGAFWGGLLGYRTQRDRWVAASIGGDNSFSGAAPAGPPAPAALTPTYTPSATGQERSLGGAATASGLHVGARVRVRHPGGPSEGNVIALDEATLTIASQNGVLPISRATIVAVETWHAEKRRTLRGALIGGVVVGLADFASDPECVGYVKDVDCTRARSVAIGAGSGVVVGAVIGALLKQTRWEPVSFAKNSSASQGAQEGGLEWGLAPTLGRKGGGLRFHFKW